MTRAREATGSAQARRREGVLQHGSLPLTGDLARITLGLRFPDENSRQQAAERLLRRALTVETALNKIVTWQEAAQAFISAFENTLDLDLQPANLTTAEIKHAELLEQTKYAHSDWTNRV